MSILYFHKNAIRNSRLKINRRFFLYMDQFVGIKADHVDISEFFAEKLSNYLHIFTQ